MDFQLSRARCLVHCMVLVSVVIGVQAFASDLSLKKVRVVNDFTNISDIIRNLQVYDNDTDLQLRCAVGIDRNVNGFPLPSQTIERGQGHTWTMNRAHEKNYKSMITCSVMTSVEKFYSFSFGIDAELNSGELEQDWLVSEGGLRRSGASEFSAGWNVHAVNERRMSEDVATLAVAAGPNNIEITVNNIMQGANAIFTRVDMQCVAKANQTSQYLGTVSTYAWQSFVWRLKQRENRPDTVFCTFNWLDDFHQRWVMASNIFDSKPRNSDSGRDLKALISREYFVTKTGLALGTQEANVALWTKATAESS